MSVHIQKTTLSVNCIVINYLQYTLKALNHNTKAIFSTLRAKLPNIKAPKCTLFSMQCFIFQGQRSQGLTGLATGPCGHREGQLTSESLFRMVESG